MKEFCRDLNHIRDILIVVLTPLVLLPLPLTGWYTVLPYEPCYCFDVIYRVWCGIAKLVSPN